MSYAIEDNYIRVYAKTNMDSIEIESLAYPECGDSKELSIVMTAEAGHVRGAIPVLDILKYALLFQPELLEKAQKQLNNLGDEQVAAVQAARAAKEAQAEAFCGAFLSTFPTKAGSSCPDEEGSLTWMQLHDGIPTTGDGCHIKGLPVLDLFSRNYAVYDLGVLKTVVDWAASQGWYAEPYDASTLKFYKT